MHPLFGAPKRLVACLVPCRQWSIFLFALAVGGLGLCAVAFPLPPSRGENLGPFGFGMRMRQQGQLHFRRGGGFLPHFPLGYPSC